MKPAYRHSVGLRLALWLTGLIAILVTLHMVIVQGEHRLARSREEDGRWLAGIVRSILARRTEGGHIKNLRDQLDAVQAQPDVVSIQIFTPEGRLFASGEVASDASFDAQFRRGAPCGACHGASGGDATRSVAHALLPGHGTMLAMAFPLPSGPECAPCHDPGAGSLGHLHVGLSLQGQEEARARARRYLIAIGAGILLLALAGIGFTVHRVVGRPLRRTVDVMERLRSGDRRARLATDRRDEIGFLSDAFNAMAERIEEVEEELRSVIARQGEEIRRGQEQLIQQEKMAALGLLAAGVAHEIGNPLTAISSIAQLLHHRTQDETVRKQTALILAQIDRISRIVREMADFARPRPSETSPTDLNELLRGALQLARYDRRAREIKVETELADDIPSLLLIPDQVFQVFFNLILNAIDAMPGGGTLTLRSGLAGARDEAGSAVAVEVEDTGSGISAEHLGRIFEPFFTTKAPGAGTGLGLSVSYSIMQAIGGRIEVTSTEGRGSIFRAVFPIHRAPAPPPSTAPAGQG